MILLFLDFELFGYKCVELAVEVHRNCIEG